MLKALSTLLLFCLLLAGCSSSKPFVETKPVPESSSVSSPAEQHYLAGALFDFEDKYHQALLEYYKALVYDSTSAQVNMAIGRDLFRIRQFQNAVTYLKRALQFNPEHEEALYFLGESNTHMQNFGHATTAFERLYAIKPFHPLYRGKLERLYEKIGSIDKLVMLKEETVEKFGLSHESAYQLLTLYMRANRFNSARELLERILEIEPDKALHWSVYGNILEVERDTTAAVQAYRKALEYEPFNSKAQQQLFMLLLDNKNSRAVVRYFSELVQLDGSNHQARLFLAEGYLYQENFTAAIAAIQPALEVSRYRASAHQLLGRIAVSRNQPQEAMTHFRALTELEPDNRQAWELLGVFHLQLDDTETAADVLGRAAERFPADARLLSLYGNALQRSGRYRDGLEPLQRAQFLDPEDLTTILTLGLVYENLRMFSHLDSLYSQALDRYPENALLLNNYSYSLVDRGVELQKALALAQRAIELEPDNGAYMDTIGWIYYHLEDYDAALSYIKKAVRQRQESAVVLEHLGDVYYRLGNLTQAIHYWRLALEKDPENTSLLQKVEK
ncbi:MAG: tetratricopeptide repeat protein [Calditrichia bacterium]